MDGFYFPLPKPPRDPGAVVGMIPDPALWAAGTPPLRIEAYLNDEIDPPPSVGADHVPLRFPVPLTCDPRLGLSRYTPARAGRSRSERFYRAMEFPRDSSYSSRERFKFYWTTGRTRCRATTLTASVTDPDNAPRVSRRRISRSLPLLSSFELLLTVASSS